jgi:hypothetical protein
MIGIDYTTVESTGRVKRVDTKRRRRSTGADEHFIPIAPSAKCIGRPALPQLGLPGMAWNRSGLFRLIFTAFQLARVCFTVASAGL